MVRLRSIVPVPMREWWDRNRLELEINDLRHEYSRRERGARTEHERESIDAELLSEVEWPDNELQALNTRLLLRVARRWHIDLPGYNEPGAWIIDDPRTGHTYLQLPGRSD